MARRASPISLPMVSRPAGMPARVLVPEIVPRERPALAIRPEAPRPVHGGDEATAYGLPAPPRVGLLVDTYG